MVRFEEEVVERWYNLRGYLTAKYVGYSSPAKKKGGKGRGEIDLLACKIGEEGKVSDCVRVEVGVSVIGNFPWVGRKRISSDDTGRLLKKFFSKGADLKVKEYFGTLRYRNQMISSEFANDAKDVLKGRLEELGAKVVKIEQKESKIVAKIAYKPQDEDIELRDEREIEIIPFSMVMKDLKKIFQDQDLMHRDFSDVVMRSIQHMVKSESKNNE
jgi:molybdopterin converting factor small subunit